MMLITKEDIALGSDGIDRYMRSEGIVLVTRYFEENIVGAFDSEVTEMLLKVCIPDDFTLPLAIMLTEARLSDLTDDKRRRIRLSLFIPTPSA